MAKTDIMVVNINRLLKGVKSQVSVDFIWSDNKGLLLTNNKVVVISNLNIIEKYLKKLNIIMCFFKKNQQFIMWGTMAVCSSYFITMYIISKQHEKRIRKSRKKRIRLTKSLEWKLAHIY